MENIEKKIRQVIVKNVAYGYNILQYIVSMMKVNKGDYYEADTM